jgi:hypothetical protein
MSSEETADPTTEIESIAETPATEIEDSTHDGTGRT